MTRKTDIEAINVSLLVADPVYNINDRGQFYIQQYALTGSEGALLEGHISMFSGAAGGNGFAANYLLADYGSDSRTGATFSYQQAEIYGLSQSVAQGFGSSASTDANASTGSLSINAGISAARDTWLAFRPSLAPYFPGNAIKDIGFGVVPNVFNDGKLVNAANHASFMFGKSLGDFSGVAGYATVAINIGNDSNISNDISYVVKNQGDRNADGKIDYTDGVVVAVANARWDYVDDPFTWNGGFGDLLEAKDWAGNWQAIRNWAPLKEFRQQLFQGANNTTDFEKFFVDKYSGEAENFWGELERQFDQDASIRNAFYIYSRYKVGTSAKDFLFGGQGNDTFDGGSGDDTLDGGMGNDSLMGGKGNDSLHGDNENLGSPSPLDIIFVAGNDTIHGNEGNDTIYGDNSTSYVLGGNDYLVGGSSAAIVGVDNDTIYGGAGNDTIFGDNSDSTGNGNDILNGGAGICSYH